MMRVRSRSSRRTLANEGFGDGVRSGCPDRCLDHFDAGCGEHRVECGGELGVTVADEESELPTGILEIHHEVMGQLGQPAAGGVCGDAEDVDYAGGVFHGEEHIQPGQPNCFQVEQVAGQDRVSLGCQELRPGGVARWGEGPIPAVWRIFHTVEAPIW
jgi:hypothetical protein